MEMEMEMEMKMKKRARILNDDLKKVLLPPEIITEILCRLPGDSAIGCRGICKQWRSLIDHPSFRDTHTRQIISSSTFNPKKFGNYLVPNSSTSSSGIFLYVQQHREEEFGRHHFEFIEYNEGSSSSFGEEEKSAAALVEFKPSKPKITDNPFPFLQKNWPSSLLISSCNGLVFFGPTKPNKDTFICNPFTREYVNLGHPTLEDEEVKDEMEEGYQRIRYGFGYLPSTNEYKVVSMHYYNTKKIGGKVSVCTLGSGKWRNKKGEIPYSMYDGYVGGEVANGIIYWFAHRHGKMIVSFDLADEEFREILIPKLQPVSSTDYFANVGLLGGCLCVIKVNEGHASPRDIWVLNHVLTSTNNMEKEEYSWNKKFSIPCKNGKIFPYYKFEPQVVLKSGKILFLADGIGTSGLVSFDPKTESFKSIFPLELRYGDRIFPYTKSFVSLKALGEENAKCWRFGACSGPCTAAAVVQ